MKQLEQNELDKLKDEIEVILDKKFGKREYMAVISVVGQYEKDDKKRVKMNNHFIRISNTDLESPYIKVKGLMEGLIVAIRSFSVIVPPENKNELKE